MSLKSLQEDFIQQLSHSQLSDNFLTNLKLCGNLEPEQQLAIYQNNVRGALQKTLAQVYPVCRKILGENYFRLLAVKYIVDHPSKHHDLNGYGEYFPDFIYTQCQQRNELSDFSYLSDLVQLEWFYHHVYYAAQGSVFDFSAFAQLTEQQQTQSVFQLVPCLKFIRSDYPVLTIWQMNQDDLMTQQSLAPHSESCCVIRKNNHIELVAIDNNLYSLLLLINDGATLEDIVRTGHATSVPELINQGWIDSFKVKHV